MKENEPITPEQLLESCGGFLVEEQREWALKIFEGKTVKIITGVYSADKRDLLLKVVNMIMVFSLNMEEATTCF